MLECDLAVRHGKMSGSNWVNWVADQTGHESKICHFNLVKKGFMSIRLRVGSGRPVFSHEFFFFFHFYKENNMYLSFGKLCNKLLDLKCIILNSQLISRINSIKLINTYSIILTLYKS